MIFYCLQKGIKNIVISSQRDFLVNWGIIIRQQLLKSTSSIKDAVILDAQLQRLIAKEQMGEIFKVMEYSSFR